VLFFTVNFPHAKSKMNSNLDNGFYYNKAQKSNVDHKDENTSNEEDVVFNIMNSFKVAEIFSKDEYDLEYGHLAAIYNLDRE